MGSSKLAVCCLDLGFVPSFLGMQAFQVGVWGFGASPIPKALYVQTFRMKLARDNSLQEVKPFNSGVLTCKFRVV